MTEYIDKAQAAAETTRAYRDGRIGSLEDILGVLDLLPVAEVGRRKENTATGGKPYARLTTDQPDDNVSHALNLFYVKGGETWGRNCGMEFEDIKLTDLIRLAAANALHIQDFTLPADDRDLDCFMADLVMDVPYSPEGILGMLHTTAWGFSALREKLKLYEDTGLTPEEVVALCAQQEAKPFDCSHESCEFNSGFYGCRLPYGRVCPHGVERWHRDDRADQNEPLTLEELRQMDGQPVWAEEPDGYKHYSRWCLVDCAWKSKGLIYLCSSPGQVMLETFISNGGKIYRHPPKEAE